MQIKKEEAKLSLFKSNMIVYVENPKIDKIQFLKALLKKETNKNPPWN